MKILENTVFMWINSIFITFTFGMLFGCRAVHDWIKPGDAFDKARADACLMAVQPPAEGQVPAAGYRLARVLNELFG